MEDLLDQLRTQHLSQQPRCQCQQSVKAPPRHRSDYAWMRLRFRAGLPGSVALMVLVACLAPYYVHDVGYLVCYLVVQLITVVRVLIAIQMNLAFGHIKLSGDVNEVAERVQQLELIHQFDRRYTLYVKVPLTICVMALIWPLIGLDPFSIRWLQWTWLGLTAVVLVVNAVVAAHAFRRLERSIEQLKNSKAVNSER